MREVSSSKGEIPSRKGYPGYLYSEMCIRDSPYSVAVIYSYLYNKEHEVNRLTIAIECVRYGVQHDEAMRYICNS